MNTALKSILVVALLIGNLTIAQQRPASKQSEIITIMNGTAHIGNGQVIKNSIIILEKGKITTITDAQTIKIKPQGKIIDAAGKHIYPGFIATNTTLGLVEVDAVKASVDQREIGTFNPHIRSLIAYNAESRVVETMRPNGVLIAQTVPRGGRISGKSSVMQLDAWNWEDAALKQDDGIHINWPASFKRTGTWYNPGPIEPSKNYKKQLLKLQDFIAKAVAYNSDKAVKTDLKLAAMKTAIDGEANVYIHVDGRRSILDVIKFIDTYKIKKPVLVGARYAHEVAQHLVKRKIPVLAGRVHDLPGREDADYDLPYKMPKLLADAGVLVALENSGDMERHQVRNFPFYAGTVAGYGMDKEQALSLITLNAAKILGIDQDYGSLETGKSATLFISQGDALDMRGNQLLHAFIDGRAISLETRQSMLSDRYMEKYNGK